MRQPHATRLPPDEPEPESLAHAALAFALLLAAIVVLWVVLLVAGVEPRAMDVR